MAKRRNKRKDDESESWASKSEDENYDNIHDKNHRKIDSSDASKQLLLEKIVTQMISKNKCADGK